MPKLNLLGKRFGMLTVINEAPKQGRWNCWFCKCDCGKEKIVKTDNLVRGFTKSCGCSTIKLQLKSRKVDMHSRDRLYRIYYKIKRRCNRPNVKYYSSKGVKLCEEWNNDYYSFYNWAMNNGYKDNLSIDRIDTNGNYCPENCRWVDMKVQNNNRRNNIKVEYKGKTYSIIELSELLGIKYRTLVARLKDYNYKVDDIVNRKLWERVNKKSMLNERYIYKNGKYYMVAIHRKYIGQTKTLKEAIALRDKKLKELEGEDE